MRSRAWLTLAAGLVLASTVALAAGAMSSSERAAASFSFGITGGTVIPFTATISPAGDVSVTEGLTRSTRPRLPIATVDGLVTLAKAERFVVLPASIRCGGTLPDIGTEFISIRTTRRAKAVRELGGCTNRRFDELYAVLTAVVPQVG